MRGCGVEVDFSSDGDVYSVSRAFLFGVVRSRVKSRVLGVSGDCSGRF